MSKVNEGNDLINGITAYIMTTALHSDEIKKKHTIKKKSDSPFIIYYKCVHSNQLIGILIHIKCIVFTTFNNAFTTFNNVFTTFNNFLPLPPLIIFFNKHSSRA